MFKNYLTTAIRNLFSNKLYAVINLGGFAVGLAAFILIGLFVLEETTHDNFWDNKENIYLLEGTISLKGREPTRTSSFTGAARIPLLNEFPEIKDITRVVNGTADIRLEDTRFREDLFITDPNFFEIFKMNFIEGNAENALKEQRGAVLTKTLAQRFFGDEPALGKTFLLNVLGEIPYKVTGVVEDLPTNTHMVFDLVVPIVHKDFDNPDGSPNTLEYWGGFSVYEYLELVPGTDPQTLNAKMADFLDRNVPETIQNIVGSRASELIQTNLTNVSDIHLESPPAGAMKPRGDMTTNLAFFIIAVLILMIAGINFMNLATVQSLKRSKEVAVRKAVGAKRRNIFSQFMGETIGLCFVALLLAFVLVQFALPYYNQLSSMVLEMRVFEDPFVLLVLGAFTLVVGLGAGFYPATLMASFRPSEIIQGKTSGSGKTVGLRKILVLAQFSVSIGLIISTGVIFSQIRYVQTLDAGYTKENVLIVRAANLANYPAVSPAFMAELEKLPEIVSVTRSFSAPGDGGFSSTAVKVAGQDDPDPIPMGRFSIGYNFFETYNIKPIAGRTLSSEYGSDVWVKFGEQDRNPNSNIVLNLAAVKALGLGTPEEALGKIVLSGRDQVSNLRVVGIVPDFNFRSARVDIRPEMYFIDENDLFPISIRFQTDRPGDLIAQIETIWNNHFPNDVFTSQYVDENLATLYAQDEVRGYLIGAFSLLAIFVSSLGLFGLAALTTDRRTKEIGVRKVMGASSLKIVRLVTWQFSKPVVLANVIAWPIAWYFMDEWLGGFVFRIDLNPLFFIGAGLLALLIAWGTVAGHAIRVATRNPINALRYE